MFNPAIVLLAGGAGSMLFWDEEFCRQLASGNRFVVRFDQRDTGRSTTYPPGTATYTARDFANDVLGRWTTSRSRRRISRAFRSAA
jgi:pimeloyl-ACP methyl ester carboxylesterase